jgi:hypothetical protein
MTRSRRADFEVAVEVVGNVADLDHFRHVCNMQTVNPHRQPE